MNLTIDILKAAGESTRLRILALLAQGELTAGELSNVLGQSQPRVSRHIKLLNEAGLIERRNEGAWVFVRLGSTEPAKSILKTILHSIPKEDFVSMRDLVRLKEIKTAREEAAQKYFEKISSEWDSLRALHQPEEAVEKTMLEMVSGQKFDFHIDLGSGFGALLGAFSKITKRAEGVDSSRGMLGFARARLDDRKDSHISVRLGNILDLPYSGNFVDLITIHQVLHYLDSPVVAIMEAARVLKPNGTLLIADFAPHHHEELREKYGHRRLGFSIDEVTGWVQSSGLEVTEIASVGETDEDFLRVNIFKVKKPELMKIDNIKENRNFA